MPVKDPLMVSVATAWIKPPDGLPYNCVTAKLIRYTENRRES